MLETANTELAQKVGSQVACAAQAVSGAAARSRVAQREIRMLAMVHGMRKADGLQRLTNILQVLVEHARRVRELTNMCSCYWWSLIVV